MDASDFKIEKRKMQTSFKNSMIDAAMPRKKQSADAGVSKRFTNIKIKFNPQTVADRLVDFDESDSDESHKSQKERERRVNQLIKENILKESAEAKIDTFVKLDEVKIVIRQQTCYE